MTADENGLAGLPLRKVEQDRIVALVSVQDVLQAVEISEALFLATRIGLMEAGELRGVYSPKEFLNATEPVAAAYLAQLRVLEEAGEGK